MDKTERSIRDILGPSLARRVISKMQKERSRSRQEDAVNEIRNVNAGYFVRPMPNTEEDKLPLEGPEQLTFSFLGDD